MRASFLSLILFLAFIKNTSAEWCGAWRYDENKKITLEKTFHYTGQRLKLETIQNLLSAGTWLIGFADDSDKIVTYNTEVLSDSLKNGLFNYELSDITQLNWSLFETLPNGRWLEYIKTEKYDYVQFEIQKESRLSGKILQYNNKKILIGLFSYVNGVANGAFATYFNDGNLLSIGFKTNNEMDEASVFFNNQKLNWRYSLLNKYEKTWSERGKLILYVELNENRQRHGIIKSWYDNGKLQFSGYYESGKPSGTWIYYNLNGRITKTERF